ncbi:bifunctional D-glycero-beta-D-manno-heptose-7-phosphate kinase/D-glycero-beta-D-manno-heptose 1-phosphate adenylyltransferase HldE [Candidatus Blochmannia ocreatus (nom. nud.)]|uniref:Bifunctional protein HldE n=1 Tax=Candidatus Blochmannia ocreatus (nom. nud.) TaxID=251538 RepID=A0ABY4SYW2_9ENTR|nr:bifunctional D-glycero-beta-D-manno-heptose-7-phosphate kinase/D-glycero-beta-D-manno-heptose 1-phosphate adenylyltransferase HldE [Candidatus Blochmannia ocreatus]URJ25152.1 bifunctional D-glycero-beta-D-manno-heptose-7-phosphate kinase/D-glycero-beta-D-manno-heptose 1-phosphate adenylyltransferase HldE [Candidatus Blochmannia ocreatus]
MTVVFPDFSQSNVLIVGDIMLDRYWYGVSNRISPEAPVPIVKVDKILDKPGGAANVAMNIASLGARSRLLGLTGSDEAAKILGKQLSQSNIDWDFITIKECPTIIKLRIISHNQQLIRLDFENNFNKVNAKELFERAKLYLPECKILVLSDYAKGSLSCIEDLIKLARCINIPVVIDPKGTQFTRYSGATILTPNISEFEAAAGLCYTEKVLISRAQEIIIDYDLHAILLTRSEQGMTLFIKDRDPLYFTTHAKDVYDVTGAGDTVVGVLSAALASGVRLEQACFLANLAAGAVVKKFGTATTNVSEIKNVMSKCISANVTLGILDENTLKKEIALVRDRGEKIVMTNGVFDVLHSGHISYLTNAKKLGDKLIVAVNSDDSTKRLKGKNRPINTLEKRMFVLAALSAVDWVVSFSEDTPTRLIVNLSPDVLVKGGDYNVADIKGGAEVLRQGGQVCALDFCPDDSSSNIISMIQKKDKEK